MKKISLVLLTVVLGYVQPGLVAAGNISLNAPTNFTGLGNLSVGGFVSWIINVILIVAAVIAFIFLLVGGVQWITSGGDKEKTGNAQKRITAALVGLVIVFAAWAIMALVQSVFAISLLSFTVPSINS